uniref:Uncharacterized protein n=1 Tax=Arion vulgaris TaxID=1028688 RepID=A0A0B6YD38_9EUPU
MPAPQHDLRNRIFVAVWLVAMLIVGVLMIVVGSLVINNGCLGICLLPYYLILAGSICIFPAIIAILISICECRRQLDQTWTVMATICLASMAIRISGTVYILSSVVRVSSLDRLCTQSWVVVIGLILISIDWILFAIFCRLFCVSQLPQSTPDTPLLHHHGQSPFHAWKLRTNIPQM